MIADSGPTRTTYDEAIDTTVSELCMIDFLPCCLKLKEEDPPDQTDDYVLSQSMACSTFAVVNSGWEFYYSLARIKTRCFRGKGRE
jgi:hypothetical protein